MFYSVVAFCATTDSIPQSSFNPSPSALPQTRVKGLIHHLSFSSGLDYVSSSVEDDIREKIPSNEKIYIHSAIPVNLKYSFSFTNPNVRNYFPGGYQGISVGILNLGAMEPQGLAIARHNIGYPILAYVFQGGPFLKFGKGLSLNYEWNFGASFGWKPWTEENKYFNLTVGSRVNAYLNLNLSLLWKLNEHTGLFGGLAVSHFSNGNTSFPNPGINSFGLRLGVVYTLNPPVDEVSHIFNDTIKKKKLEYDISLWGASRKRVYRGGEEPVLLPGHFACAGISFAPMVHLNTWWRVGGSVDIQWDQSSDMKRNYIEGTTTQDIKFTNPNFFRQISLGVSAHGELQMPIFAVNVGMGYNIIAPWENRNFYQNITLKTYLCSKLYLNVGYQLRNFYQQSSLMLGMGMTI
ncbi:MAG: acyloxyacyl hydrolase [Muribaculaceae bacterium]|nr:acyloxyacyl hydrolase [Muribaculaceae bacterium]